MQRRYRSALPYPLDAFRGRCRLGVISLREHARLTQHHQLKLPKHIMHGPSLPTRCAGWPDCHPIHTSFTLRDTRFAARPSSCTIRG